MAVQQCGSIAISNFGTKWVLNPTASESIPFWFQKGDIYDKNSGYKRMILSYILSPLDTFPAFFFFFSKFGTKMGLRPQPSIYSHSLEVAFSHTPTLDTSF